MLVDDALESLLKTDLVLSRFSELMLWRVEVEPSAGISAIELIVLTDNACEIPLNTNDDIVSSSDSTRLGTLDCLVKRRFSIDAVESCELLSKIPLIVSTSFLLIEFVMSAEFGSVI